MIPANVSKYLEARGIKGPWKISGTERRDFEGAVVIPALAEKDSLFATLETLAQNPSGHLSAFLILVVVNHREDAESTEKADNRFTLKTLEKKQGPLASLQLGWVDACTEGRELPTRGGGVGLARKIGFDLALSRLEFERTSPLVGSLDADTLVRSDYFPAIVDHFRDAKDGGAVIPFCHQKSANLHQDRAIHRYELFLRTYVLGLDRAGSPFAFHTIGSTMACRAEAYARMGGMNMRDAGEDFYFLQHLAKTSGVVQMKGTVVYPSPRASTRVPFGTGKSVSRLLADDKRGVLFYRRECFQILKEWLSLVTANLNLPGEVLFCRAKTISADLAEFLAMCQFIPTWGKLQNNFRSPSLLLKGFHQWFDGFKTLKLVHHLSAGPFPRGEPEEVLPGFFAWAGLEPAGEVEGWLFLLRRIQIGAPY